MTARTIPPASPQGNYDLSHRFQPAAFFALTEVKDMKIPASTGKAVHFARWGRGGGRAWSWIDPGDREGMALLAFRLVVISHGYTDENNPASAAMLVTHLNTYDKSGGAAIAAWRLHLGMRSIGVESRMVSRFRSGPETDVSCIDSDVFAAADLFQRMRVKPGQPAGATLFSVSATAVPLHDHPWIAAADVVHLHWVAGFVSPEDVEQLCLAGKTVFWTLHDQWPYTGGCHYVGGTRRREDDWDGTAQIGATMHALARMERERKKRIFQSPRLHVIAPSRWMAREAAASGVFAPERIHVIPYGFDLSVFSPPAERLHEDSEEAVTLLFGCQHVSDRRKGYRELQEAILLAMADPGFAAEAAGGRIRLQTFGTKPPEEMELPIPVVHLGMLTDESEISALLGSSSAFVCPTLDDNLPNVVMESLACGCPVVAFATGGVPDMVTHGGNGLLAEQGDVAGLSRLLMDFCLDAALRQRLRAGARRTDPALWSLETQARRVKCLYQSVVSCDGPSPGGSVPDALPLLKLEGRILPHIAPDLCGVLVAECLAQKSAVDAQARESARKMQQAAEQIARLGKKLADEAALRRDMKLKLKDRQTELKRSKTEIKALKKRRIFHRMWRAIRRRWKG